MKISIVMSTYNGEKFILEQLESLKQQTCQIDEVLINDDCSTDNTFLIIESFIRSNNLKNWSLTQNQINNGWKVNFWNLTKKAKGDIIFFCDQDDIWMNNKVERMISEMSKNDKIELLMCNYYPYYETKKIQKISNKILNEMKNDNKVNKIRLNKNFLFVNRPGCTYAFKKNFFYECDDIWNPNMGHDALLWYSGIIMNKAYILDEPLIEWRRNSSSTTTVNLNQNILKYKYQEKLTNLKNNIDFLNVVINDEFFYDNKVTNKKLLIETLDDNKRWYSFMKNKNVLKAFKEINTAQNFRSSKKTVITDIILIFLLKILRKDYINE